MKALLHRTGSLTIAFLRDLGGICNFAVRSWRWLPFTIASPRRLAEYMYDVGIRSLLVVITVSIFIGMTVTIQAHTAFREVGADGLLGFFSGLINVREMGPLMAAALVGAKAGSQMAATIGTMRVKEQIDALEVMAVNPYRHLIAPRIAASLLVVPLLVLVAEFASLTVSYLVAVFQLHQDGAVFLDQVYNNIKPTDLLAGMAKGAAFGIVLSTICCYYGFKATRGAAGVGRATNQAVVVAATVCILINVFLSEIFYG